MYIDTYIDRYIFMYQKKGFWWAIISKSSEVKEKTSICLDVCIYVYVYRYIDI